MGGTRFVFNREAFSTQVLKSTRIQDRIEAALIRAVGDRHRYLTVRRQTQGRTRNGGVVIAPARNRAQLQQVLAEVGVQ